MAADQAQHSTYWIQVSGFVVGLVTTVAAVVKKVYDFFLGVRTDIDLLKGSRDILAASLADHKSATDARFIALSSQTSDQIASIQVTAQSTHDSVQRMEPIIEVIARSLGVKP